MRTRVPSRIGRGWRAGGAGEVSTSGALAGSVAGSTVGPGAATATSFDVTGCAARERRSGSGGRGAEAHALARRPKARRVDRVRGVSPLSAIAAGFAYFLCRIMDLRWPGVLLFKKAFWEGLTSGAITLTFRRWKKSHVRPGGRYRCHPIGVLEVDAVRLVPVSSITTRDAKRAGFPSLDALLAYLSELGAFDEATEIHRVELHHGGDGDRVPTALEDQLTADDVQGIREKLARLDAKAPWTMQTFALIEKHPRIPASQLAAKVGRETAAFKADVVKLKKLGLTQSFEVGYEIAPRGRAYLAAIGGTRRGMPRRGGHVAPRRR